MWYFAPTRLSVSIAIIVQFAALAVIVGIGVCVVYAIFEMREVYADQREKFVRAVSAVEEFHKLQPEFISLLGRVESDGHALQKIAMQIEVAVAALKNTIISSLSAAADRQTNAIENFCDHVDSQEQELAKIVERLSENLLALPQARPAPSPQMNSEPKTENGDYIRLRKEIVSGDPGVRFSVLKDWLSMNWLAILHHASRGWNAAPDLIANIPAYLEAEAEIHNGCVLIIGTRGHAEKLALPIREADSSSEPAQWFEAPANGNGARHIPAVLIRSNGHFELISKGSAHEVLS